MRKETHKTPFQNKKQPYPFEVHKLITIHPNPYLNWCLVKACYLTFSSDEMTLMLKGLRKTYSPFSILCIKNSTFDDSHTVNCIFEK